jgi:hypothetical protein
MTKSRMGIEWSLGLNAYPLLSFKKKNLSLLIPTGSAELAKESQPGPGLVGRGIVGLWGLPGGSWALPVLVGIMSTWEVCVNWLVSVDTVKSSLSGTRQDGRAMRENPIFNNVQIGSLRYMLLDCGEENLAISWINLLA